jgi:hypothetical protein
MPQENIDANKVEDSSSSTAATATESQVQEQNRAQSQQSPADNPDDKQESISDVVARIKEKHNIDQSESSTEKQADAEGAVLKKNQTPAEAKNAEVIEEQTTGDDSKLPFHKHPRFQQVIKERGDFESKVKELEPAAQRMLAIEDYCRKNQINPQDYDDALRFAAVLKGNPQEAVKQLKELTSTIEVALGVSLPNDLQQQVDDGKLGLDQAKELARVRFENQTLKQRQQNDQRQAQENQQRELQTSLQSWVQNKQKLDPAFKEKSQGTDDGKFELVNAQFLRLWNDKAPQTVADAIALADRAYEQVSKFISSAQPKTQVRRPITSTRSSQEQTEQIDVTKPGWARRVAANVLARHERA